MSADTVGATSEQHEIERLRRRIAELEQVLALRVGAGTEPAARDLLHSLSLVEAAFEATADGILVVDSHNTIVRFNHRFIELWQIPPAIEAQALTGNSDPFLTSVLNQLQDPEQFVAGVMALYAEPARESFDTIHFSDGRVFERYSRPQRVEGAIVGRVWSFRDVTARVRADKERAAMQEELIRAQAAALAELSTPLIPISDSTVVMPLIGAINSRRVHLIMESLLEGVSKSRASWIILDITGVPVVDTHIANALISATQAVSLLGARGILTGIRPEVAQTLVGLGVNLQGLITRGTLQDGIAHALRHSR